MKFHIVGADRETGNDVEIDVTATDRAEAEQLATRRGVMVSAVTPVKDADPEQIEMVIDDAPAQPAQGGPGGTVSGAPLAAGGTAAGAPSPGASHAGASRAGESHGSISGQIGQSTSQPGAHLEYHVIINQSLYLLEVAVNKHIKDGWEPQGGLAVGVSNNAQQFYQAMIRHKD